MKTILIIEDSEQNLYLTRYILEQHGYTVEAAPDGPSGIATALRLRPDLILLDVQLPGMDGYQVAASLRSHAALARTPIVAVTSYAMAGDRERVLEAGCTGYLEKPINPETFVSQVERHFQRTTTEPKGIHVLVADDAENNRELLTALFRANGWKVTCASNGSEALSLARQNRPDVIISDILMPGMDGFSLCREWRRDAVLAGAPFVFYSATYTDPQDARFGLSLGANAYLIKPMEPESLIDRVRQVLDLGEGDATVGLPSEAGDEEMVLREYNAALVRKLEDKMLQVESLNRELEHRVRERTRDLEAANRQLQAFAHVGTWVREMDPVGRLIWSCQACRIFGVTPEAGDHLWSSFLQRVHPDDVDNVRQADAWVRSGRGRMNLQHRIVLSDGNVRWVHQEGDLVRDAEGRPIQVAGMVRDITEFRAMEDQLRQSQKLEAVGQLAGGVAHDFNNLITVIHGNCSLLETLYRLPEGATASVREMMVASEKAARLTRQLLAFGRRQAPQFHLDDLNRVVRQMAGMLVTLAGKRIVFEVHYAADLPEVRVDASMIEQVVMNLAVNARDAMPNGGRMTLGTSAVDLDEPTARTLGRLSPGRHACLAVGDNGRGIDAAHLEHIFEPFYTTKDADKGSGLGLAVAYGIMRQHGGHIAVQSECGRGTTFTLYFPEASRSGD